MAQQTEYKRSNEPIFWGLFGFGGMVIAFALPALLICMIIAGFTDGHRAFHLLEVTSHWWGAAAIFLILFGVAFHAAHRIVYSMHDLGVHTTKIHHIVVYVVATLITLAAAGAIGMHFLCLG